MKRVEYNAFGGPERMRLADIDLPEPGPEDVRVAIKAAAVNPFDWKLRNGAMRLVTGRRFPKAMGTDFSGIVVATGKDVRTFREGDQVLGTADFRRSGAFAEGIVVGARHVVHKPAAVSFLDAACLPIPAMTAWVALFDKGMASPGRRILVHGCSGAVGRFAVQMAAARGIEVIGVSRAGAPALSASLTQNLTYDDLDAIRSAGKFDLIFDAAGTLDVGEGLTRLTPQGRVVDINPTLGRWMRAVGSLRYRMAFATAGLRYLPEIAQLSETGVLRPTIGTTLRLEDAIEGIRRAEMGGLPPGRLVLSAA